MSKQEAIDLFKEGNFLESEKIFYQLIEDAGDNGQKIELYEFLLRIQEKLNKAKYLNSRDILLELYTVEGMTDSFQTLYKTIKHPDFFQQNLNLKNLWEIKNLELFDFHAKEISQLILVDKLYVHALEVFSWIKERRKWLLYPYFSLLMYFLDIGDEQKSLEVIKKIEDFVLNKWSKLEVKKGSQTDYLIKINELLGNKELQSYQLQGYKKLLEIKLVYLKKIKKNISKKNIISLIVLNSENPLNLSYLLFFIQDEDIHLLLVDYLKKYKKDITFSSDNPFKKIGNYFEIKRKVNINKNDNKQYFPLNYNVQEIDEVYDESIFEEYLSSNENAQLKRNEFAMKSFIQHNDSEVRPEREGLAIALMQIGLVESVELLLKDKDESISSYYIQSELYYEHKKNADVIRVVNEAFAKFDLTIEQRIPFYYLKACAYLETGKKVEAQNIFSLIATYHPNFRSLEEKLLSE